MLHISHTQRYFLYSGQTDMRKGFDTLCGIVIGELGKDPLGGDVFIFLSRRRTRIKLLQWQGDGYALYYKRLERGAFEMPEDASQMSGQQLMLMLAGIQLSSVKKRLRYEHHFVNKKPAESAVSEGL